MSDISVGSTLWYFDHNKRVYRTNEKGMSIGGPIWLEHWREAPIISETKVSWVTQYYGKINKKELSSGKLSHLWATNRWELVKGAWMEQNRLHIARDVSYLRDYETLRRVAEIIDYKEK